MSKLKASLAAGLLLLAAGLVSAAQMPLAIPKAGRIGIIDLMTADVTHFHVGSTPVKSFLRTYRGAWSAAEVIEEPLFGSLASEGLEPVSVQPSELLRRQKQAWIINKPQAAKLPGACLDELQRIMDEEKLSAIIIVAPGPNTDPEGAERNRMKKLPEYIQGWGFSTSDEPGGLTRPVVFNLMQIALVGKTTDGARLQFRDWGGSSLFEWQSFAPPEDLKSLPEEELAKLRPVIADGIKRQIARVMPHLQR